METRLLLIAALLLFISYVAPAQKTFHGCGMTGNAKVAKVKALNRDKNRYNLPSDDNIDASITLQAILETGDDENRFTNTDAAELTGYVYDVKVGGIETCNCKATESEFRDTHIELLANPNKTAGWRRVIVEVTPRIRKMMADKGVDWSTSKLKETIKNKWVKVRGWLLFDTEHWYNAQNTNPSGDNIWRATCWEIHPITNIEVVTAP